MVSEKFTKFTNNNSEKNYTLNPILFLKMEKSVFVKHPSSVLNELYSKKNYQGANPVDAKIIFVGRDPNWAIDIENKQMFAYVAEYLADGVGFWKTHHIHHPFLLPNYKGDGKRYHKMFSKLKIQSGCASQISFVELIGFPTTGMAKKSNKLFLAYLTSPENANHLVELENLLNDSQKIIFIAWGLLEDFKYLNKKTGLFAKLAALDKAEMNIDDLNQSGNIYIHRHFSDAISGTTLERIETQVKLNLQ